MIWFRKACYSEHGTKLRVPYDEFLDHMRDSWPLKDCSKKITQKRIHKMKVKVKVKFTVEQPTKAQRGVEV
jgi:hypothetical protein